MSECEHDWNVYDIPKQYRICYQCHTVELWHPKLGYIPAKIVVK